MTRVKVTLALASGVATKNFKLLKIKGLGRAKILDTLRPHAVRCQVEHFIQAKILWRSIMADDEVKAPTEQVCVVCGQGSHRESWIKKLKNFVSCDHHTDKEIADAVTAQQKASAPAPTVSSTGQPASGK